MRTIALAAAFFALCANAAIYKWVDEKGQTQYGEIPPPGVAATKMGASTGSEGAAAPAGDKPKDEAQAPKDAAGRKPLDKEARAARCEFEQGQLRVLESDAPVLAKGDKGEAVPIDEAKRESAKSLVRDNIKKYCS